MIYLSLFAIIVIVMYASGIFTNTEISPLIKLAPFIILSVINLIVNKLKKE